MMPFRSIRAALRRRRSPVQYQCNVCGEIVAEDDYEGPECPQQYDMHENTLGAPAHYVDCEGTLEQQEITPWEDRSDE